MLACIGMESQLGKKYIRTGKYALALALAAVELCLEWDEHGRSDRVRDFSDLRKHLI